MLRPPLLRRMRRATPSQGSEPSPSPSPSSSPEALRCSPSARVASCSSSHREKGEEGATTLMEGMEMEFRGQQHMHNRRRCVQMSEDERRERREQQRLWYRRRRSQMTHQEIAFQNEQRRLKYRLQKLRASTEQDFGVIFGNPMPGMHGGSSQVNGGGILVVAEEKGHREGQRIHEWSAWMTGQQIELQEQLRLKNGQGRWQVSGERVTENGGQQQQWRWKVEARKARANTVAHPADLNLMVGDASGTIGVNGHSDDSETTETDESLQDMLPGRHCGAVVEANRLPDVDHLRSSDEATSKAPSFEGAAQMHQFDKYQAGCVPQRVRLTQIKRLARAMYSHSAS